MGFHISASGSSTWGAAQPPVPSDCTGYSPIFDATRLNTAVETANSVTTTYGVTTLSINIIAANPGDKALQVALAKGAVASAEAEQAETVARGEAKSAEIRAEGDAQAELIRAEASKKAAEMLSESEVAVNLALISRTGECLNDKTSFFFNSDPTAMGALLSNPAMVQAR